MHSSTVILSRDQKEKKKKNKELQGVTISTFVVGCTIHATYNNKQTTPFDA
jgi:hypothetical protein